MGTRAYKSALWLSAALATAACGDDESPGKDLGDGQEHEYDFASFDTELQAFLDENGLAGASAAIVHKEHGILHEQGYGAFAKDRLYLIASASKILSVGVLMRLADQGLVDLDAPISDTLGDWGDYKSDISVAQLVSNSSGMLSLLENPLYPPYLCQYLEGGSLSDCARTIYTADDEADRVAPDTVFKYGGGQWQLAGGIAEVASGKSWAELIQETYVEPCGVSSLGYSNHYQQASLAGSQLGYPAFFEADPGNLPDTANPSVEGGAYVNVGDYAKLVLMHLRGGLCDDNRVLSEDAVARMQEDRIAAYGGTTPNPDVAGYGLGWWVDRDQPGLVVDPGAYGAVAWIDNERGYGAFIALEDEAATGEMLRAAVQPHLEALFE